MTKKRITLLFSNNRFVSVRNFPLCLRKQLCRRAYEVEVCGLISGNNKKELDPGNPATQSQNVVLCV